MENVKAFIDSDVIISSLISKTGAGHLLLNNPPLEFDAWISNHSTRECKKVCKRLNLKKEDLKSIVGNNIATITLNSMDKLKSKYGPYASDPNDVHIIAGAVEAKTQFLVTYNQKDYLERKIKNDFGIIVLTPGMLLQFLRSKAAKITFQDSNN